MSGKGKFLLLVVSVILFSFVLPGVDETTVAASGEGNGDTSTQTVQVKKSPPVKAPAVIKGKALAGGPKGGAFSFLGRQQPDRPAKEEWGLSMF